MLNPIPLDAFEELRHKNRKLDESMACLDTECHNLALMNGSGDKIRARILAVVKALLSPDTDNGTRKQD